MAINYYIIIIIFFFVIIKHGVERFQENYTEECFIFFLTPLDSPRLECSLRDALKITRNNVAVLSTRQNVVS